MDELDLYLFDLRGYLLIRKALDKSLVSKLNDGIDALLPMSPGEWKGHVHRQGDPGTGEPVSINLAMQNMYEAGEPFEQLIDHPSYIDHVSRFVGGDDGLFIDEGFVTINGPDHSGRLHSGAHKRRIRTQFRYHNGEFRCGQVNVLIALRDLGDGDGPTRVIPGSHKSNLIHPALASDNRVFRDVVVEGAIDVPLQAGDAILFVDALAHGAGHRTNDGDRRVCIYRYGPHWGNNRHGYVPSDELLERLTPARRKIIQPLLPRRPAVLEDVDVSA
jgi:hypothetical protein